jgi:hypothetical protein
MVGGASAADIGFSSASDDSIIAVNDAGDVLDTGDDGYFIGGTGDLNDDGSPEIVYYATSPREIHYADAEGNVVNTGAPVDGDVGGIGDFNDDGDTEVAYINGGNIKFVDDNGNIGDTGVDGSAPGGMTDFDGDGDLDILYLTSNDNIGYVDSSGNTGTVTSVSAQDVGWAGDLDSDGHLEVAFRNEFDNIKVVDKNGDIDALGVSGYFVGGVGDFTGDGDLDVAYHSTSGSNIKVVDFAGNVVDTGKDGIPGGMGTFINKAPKIDSTTVDPDPPLIGESVSYSADASDPDGSISDLELTVFQDGTQVYQSTTSSSSNTWSDVYTANEGNLDARFIATDNAGATNTKWINRTLSETAPDSPTINSPTGTFNDETIEYDISTSSDGDDNKDESLTLTLEEDGNQVDQVTTTEGNTVTGSYTTSGEGSHSFDVTVEEPDGETSSASTSYSVDFIDPTVDSVTVTPDPFDYQDNVDISVDASDNTKVQQVCVQVDKDGSNYVGQTCRNIGSTTVSETFNDYFTVDETNSDYTVNVEVTDNQGETGTSSTTYTVNNDAPTSSASFTPGTWNYQDNIDVNYDFSDANGNFDYGEIKTYKDNTVQDTYTVNDLSGTYTDALLIDETNSDYKIEVTAYDLQGASDTFTETQTVSNDDPTVSASYSPSDWTFNDNVDISYDFSDPNNNIDSRSIEVYKDSNLIESYSPTQNSGTVTDAFLVDETDATYEVQLDVTDLQGATGSSSTSQFVSNTAPIAELNATPETWFYEDQIDLEYDIVDNEGDIQTREIRVFEAGTRIDTISLTSNSGIINDAFTTDLKDTEYQAQLFLEDSAGQTDSESITQTITDNAPNINLVSPGNQSFWTYNVPLEFDVSDMDTVNGEFYSCNVDKDGSLYEKVYLKEGSNSTYSDTVRSDLGSHTVDVSCTDGSGNTGSASENYQVKMQELVGQTHPDPVYETNTPQSNIEVKLGEMASKISATLVFNSTDQQTSTTNHSGIGNEYLTAENTGIPLIENNATTENSYWNYTVDYTSISGTETSDTFTTPQAPQTIYQAIFNPSVTSDSDRYIEKENPELSYVYDTNNWNGDVSCTLEMNGTTKNQCQTSSIDSGIPNGASETLTASGTGTASFQGQTRSIGQATKNIDVHRKILTDCSTAVHGVTGSEALQLQLLNEENRTQTLTGNIAYNFDITHHGEHTRNYAFDKNSVDSTKTCLYPDWAEYTANGPIQYSSDSSQNNLSTNFPDRQYNLINQTLDSNRDEIDLYLLPEQYSTPVYFEVTDQAGEGVQNVVVTVQRYFIGSNSYLTIAKSQTDSNGVATTYLRVNEIYYKYTVKDQDGNVLLETNREILTCQTSPCTKELRVNPEADNPYFQHRQGFSYNTSRITSSGGNLTGFQATVSHDSSVFKKANLVVTRNSGIASGNICNITASSNPSTMVCSFDKPAGDDNIDYTLTGYTDGNKYLLDKGILNGAPNVFQDNAYFAGFILFAMFSMIGLASPKTGIIFSTAGIIVPWYLGFYALSTAAVGSLALVAIALVVTNTS